MEVDMASDERNGRVPFHVTAVEWHVEITKHLFEPVPESKRKGMRNVIHRTAQGGNIDVAMFLIAAAGKNIALVNCCEGLPLHLAVRYERLEIVTVVWKHCLWRRMKNI